MQLQKISCRFSNLCIVAASGPSLTAEVARACAGHPVVAVNDAYLLFPEADVLYAADGSWWEHHNGCPDFKGERWSSHGNAQRNDKRAIADRFGLNVVKGIEGEGFCLDPDAIHYGDNSGFQADNLAGHMLGWRGRIVMVGFDMRIVEGRRHFFGEHPRGLRSTDKGYADWPKLFAKAAKSLPPDIEIVNCTPGSALTCFPMMDLAAALQLQTIEGADAGQSERCARAATQDVSVPGG